MRLVTFRGPAGPTPGVLVEGGVVDLTRASGGRLPATVLDLLRSGPDGMAAARELAATAAPVPGPIELLAPWRPPTVRDFMAFEEHVRDARAHRGLTVPPEWYELPVFYFSNPNALVASGESVSAPPGCQCLDFELEVGAVIGMGGRSITRQRAWEHVAGLVLVNDWSARDLQLREMAVGLGPSKGKDFALGLGPWLLTLDELGDRIDGEQVHLEMVARVNGVELCRANLDSIFHTLPRLVEHASRGVDLLPGELLGSGTVGGGCLLERGPGAPWLQPGDVVELEVERLGVLRNRVGPG
ncbi:MAG: fumarylacetoacetate hydrolase family protein [Candidatus Dormibacteria bacterium]